MRYRAFAMVAALALGSAAEGQWPQWGGPGRDFSTGAEVEAWGELGPRVLWLRPLGPGYSGIVVAGGRLFTMTREGEEEVVVALAAADGRELWRHAYAASTAGLRFVDISYGDAPQATPLLAEGRLYGLGFTGVLTAVDAASGEERWSRNLVREHRTGIPYFGHAASPLRVGETVVVLAGGALAFDLESGELRWENRDFAASYASPILVDTPAGEQIVAAAAGELVGLDPRDGRLLWRIEHANQHKTFLSSPAVGAEGTLFASAYFLGSIALRFGPEGVPAASWRSDALEVSQTNSLAIGSLVVASHNRNLIALDLASGEQLWREKGRRRSNLVRAGGKVLLLDERGGLSLAEVGREGFRTLAETRILEGRSWTAPSLDGRRLYARNGEEIVAVDLAAAAAEVGQTAAGLRERPTRRRIQAPPAFLEAAAAVERAALRADPERLALALARLEPFAAKPELAPHVHYYRGFAAWQRSHWGPRDEKLERVDAAVEALQRAIELDGRFAEAHALLAPLYAAYWQLDPRRAGVIGPLGDEHLETALELEADNPRVMVIEARDLLTSPPRYGGDPARGEALLDEALRRLDAEEEEATNPRPRWGASLARVWLAEHLLERGEAGPARKLLEEALRRVPDLASARRLLEASAAPRG